MSRLRGFQTEVKQKIYGAFADGAHCVMPVIPTGGGKTVLMGDIAREYEGYGCAIAHRSELVMQIACALAKEGVRHDIIAPTNVIRGIVAAQIEDCGRSYYDARANWKVASVDTILRRDLDQRWRNMVGLTFQDEGHHVLADNKWGKAQAMFPNARGIFPTATPIRADKKGLGRHAHGLVDALVVGPDMRWMIENAYLVDYEIRAPTPSDFDMKGVDISPVTGDYNLDQMRKRVKESQRRIGDIVGSYLQFARGKLGITFAVDIEDATSIAEGYNKAGVPAMVVSSETTDTDRRKIMQRFCNRELLQLVNVDLFGEGVDVPMLEVISMARPTASYALYVQQFGRVLRLMISPILAAAWDTYTVAQRKQFIAESGKPVGLILDHVGNVITHSGPPDYRKEPWTLDAGVKGNRANDGIAMRVCVNPTCIQPYERFHVACPYCGMEPPPPGDRSKPENVDGDMTLYSPELLAQLFGERARIDGEAVIPYGQGPIVAASARKMHEARKQAQEALRAAMALVLPPGSGQREAIKKFYLTFGVDTLTAQTLGSAEADKLRQRIIDKVTGK